MATPIGRREFLRGLGAAGATTLAGCSDHPGPAPVAPVPDGWMRGEERWITTTCGQCPAGCGIRVRVREGTALKIEGNPNHPINRAGVGPKGQAGLDLLYHPDRVRGPRKRRGPRGSGDWEPITWAEAIASIAGRLADLRTQGRPHELVVLDGEPRSNESQLWRRFLGVYGSPNHVVLPPWPDGAQALATAFMNGVPELPAYDWHNTRYVLVFGAGLFESWCQTIHMIRTTSSLRRGTPGRSQKFVQISPRFSRTAAKADEWVPIVPGTYGMLALGLAHVLIQDKRYDEAFVRDHCFGFDDWVDGAGHSHRGFRTLVLEDFAPEKVSEVTGVPLHALRRLARDMTENRPAIALADAEATATTSGLGTAMAIHALNALLGSLERPGGLLTQRPAPLASWVVPERDEVAQKSSRMPSIDGAGTRTCALGGGCARVMSEAILAGTPYPVSALVFARSNPVSSSPVPRRWIEAIHRVPLVVSLATLADESTLWADFVLPTSTYLEQWEVVEPAPSAGYPVLGLRQPVVAPVHDSLAGGDIVIRLAKAVGAPVDAAFSWNDARKAMEERLQGIVDADRGSVTESDVESLVPELAKSGGWWDPSYSFEEWKTAFPTPSGKFEFVSRTIAARLDELFPDDEALAQQLGRAVQRREDLCLPHWVPLQPAGAPEQYPFLLEAYRGIENAAGGQRYLAVLRELPGAGRWSWRDRVELNPQDAADLDIHHGDMVWIESPSAKRRVCAVVASGVRPGTIALPLGGGVWPPTAEDATGVHALLAERVDPLAGVQSLHETRVRVWKDGA